MQYFNKLKRIFTLVHSSILYWYNCLLITQSCLYVAQASSSFKCFDTCHATPTFITEMLCHVTYVQLFEMTVDGLYSGSLCFLSWFT